MKSFHNILIAAAVLSFLPAMPAGAVEWKSSYNQALNSAKESGRPVMIDFYAEWCNYCRKMKSDVYPSDRIQRKLNRFVTVSIDGEKHPDIAAKYGVDGFPTVVFLDQNGVLLYRYEGYADTDRLSSLLNTAWSKRNRENEILEEIRKNPENIKSNYQAGAYYFRAGNYEKARSYFLKGYTSKKEDVSGHRLLSVYNAAVTSMRLDDYSSAVSFWNAYLSLSPYKNSDYAYARYYRAVSFLELGLKEDAVSDLEYASEFLPLPEERKKAESLLN